MAESWEESMDDRVEQLAINKKIKNKMLPFMM